MPWTTFPIDGGLDLITPAQGVQPGRMLDCYNFEVARARGARLIDGYEPFDGGPSPSSTGAALLQLFGQGLVYTNFPAGTIVEIASGGTYPAITCTVVSAAPASDLSIPATGAYLYVKLSHALPVPVSSLPNSSPGSPFYLADASGAFLANLVAASGGYTPGGIAAPTGLTGQAVTTISGVTSTLVPGAYYYAVTATNANGETFQSAQVSITTDQTVHTTTNGAITAALFFVNGVQTAGFQVPVASLASLVVGDTIYITDGTYTLIGPIWSMSNGVLLVTQLHSGLIPTGMTVGSNVLVTNYVNFMWTFPANPDNVPPVNGYKIYRGTTPANLTLIYTIVGALDGNTIPYFSDTGYPSSTTSPPTSNTTGSIFTQMGDLSSLFAAVAPTVQKVPGQGNVNGLFWLKDSLYAVRDYLAVSFSSGNYEPAIGDTLYQGASFGAATWTGQVAKINLSTGSWDVAGSGTAAGAFMVYNTTGTLSAAALNNNTQSQTGIATASTVAAASTAAGMYVAQGGRGATAATQSWQWCDLGWTIQYDTGSNDFVDMNLALDEANAATNRSLYVTTPWRTGQSGTTTGSHWFPAPGASTSFPACVGTQGDGFMLAHNFASSSNAFLRSGVFHLTNFGFTDTDIPATATITGVEIQFVAGAAGISGSNTASPIDLTYELYGLASGEKRSLCSSTLYPVTESLPSITPMGDGDYNLFNFSTRLQGAPDETTQPTSLLGYTSITPADVKSSNFGIAYQVGLNTTATAPLQQIQFGIDFIQMRFSYLPQTNMYYFWDGKVLQTITDAVFTAGSTTMTSASGAFTSAHVGRTITNALVATTSTVKDALMLLASPTQLNSNTIGFTVGMIGQSVTISGAGAQVGANHTDGAMTSGLTTLTCATSKPFLATMVGDSVFVSGAGVSGATLFATIVGFTDTSHVTLNIAASTNVTGTATVKIFGPLTTTITGYTSPSAVTIATPTQNSFSGGTLTLYGKFSASIVSVTNATTVVLSQAPGVSLSGQTVLFYQPVVAQCVQHYQQGGVLTDGTAKGVVYFHFIQYNGTVGGPPVRAVNADETIRSLPNTGVAPDGGYVDGSTAMAMSASAASMNVMDWSSLLAGNIQPDGSTAPAGKYQSVTQNFYGSSGLEAIYGVSGGGPAFYYDGFKITVGNKVVPGNFARILTGMPLKFDCPRSICAHQGHLVLGYYSGMVQWGNTQNVLDFNPLHLDRTASITGVGQPVTCLASINGDALVIGARQIIYMLQGNLNSPSTVLQSTISPTSGMLEYSLQPMANYMFCDFRGVTMIGATQKYGDFEIGHISSQVSPWIIPRVQTSAFFESTNRGFVNSYLSRNKNQYRAVFADGYQLTASFIADGEPPQFTIQQLLASDGATPVVWNCVQAFTERQGRDRIFAAASDSSGFVYELDRGTSFNGAPISAYVNLVPDVSQTPYQEKAYEGINVFGQAQDYAAFTISRAANYDTPVQGTGLNQISGSFGALINPVTGQEKSFAAAISSAIQMEGTALSLRFDSQSATQFSFTLQAVSYNIEALATQDQ